jgi:DNA replication protein DnaC
MEQLTDVIARIVKEGFPSVEVREPVMALITKGGVALYHAGTWREPEAGAVDCDMCLNHGHLQFANGDVAICPDCYNREQKKRISKLNAYSSWSVSAAGQTFDTFIQRDAHTKQAAALAESWCQLTGKPQWLYLHGRPGCGKTHLAAACANMLTGPMETPTLFITSPEMFGWLRDAFDKGPNDAGERVDFDTRIQIIMRAPALVLDDLGAEKSSDWTDEVLWRIMDYRYRNRLATLIVSNLSPHQLRAERLTSRLNDVSMSVVFEIKSDDFRRKTKAERAALRGTK